MTVLLYLLFILSGAAGLFYESVWSRYLSLFVGHGAYAQVIVLVIFLGGMALGAMLVSRRSAKLEDPLYGYAVIEVLIGLVGLVFHDLLYVPVTGWAYDSLFPALGGGAAVGIAKWALAGLLILPQSIMLGATFPLMSAGLIRRRPSGPARCCRSCTSPTAWAPRPACCSPGSCWSQMAGLPGTLLAAAILNLLVGLVAFFVAKLHPPEASRRSHAGPERLHPLRERRIADCAADARAAPAHRRARHRHRILRLRGGVDPAALAGPGQRHAFVRADALGLHPGSLAGRFLDPAPDGDHGPAPRDARHHPDGDGRLRAAQPRLLPAIVPVDRRPCLPRSARTDQGYTLYTLARYALCLVIMLPATFCAGMTLPLITRTLFVSGAGEAAIGRVYSWNTFGSIIGAAAASLLLIPLLGLKGTLILGGVMDMAVGLLIVWLL